MSGAEDFIAPPPLGPELASGKWKVRIIDGDARITEERISGKEVWSMQNRRVMFDFNTKGQAIKDSGGCRCRDLKQRLWDAHRRNTIQEAFESRPGLVPEDQWREFVEMQFTDKAKKMRERNIKSRSKHKMPHALGKKSLARKAHEMEEETGIEPSRSELFITSRTRSDGSFVCNEARISVDKLKQVMTENIQSEAHDAFEQVFGPEQPGRVRCVGRGPTPSKMQFVYYYRDDIYIKSEIKGLADKLDVVANAVYALIESRKQEHIQANARDENTKLKTNFHQSSSINSD
ncbi:unnamed protein product, partial [Thlaspi arvense]